MDPIGAVIIGTGVLVLCIGLAGAILPGLPGPAVSAAGSLILQVGLSIDGGSSGIGWGLCLISVILGIIMTVADFIAPGIVAAFGGSGKKSGKYAMIAVIIAFVVSCTGAGPVATLTAGLGAIPAVFFGLMLITFAAFLGGFLGELDDIPREEAGRTERALKAGFAHMVALGLSTVAKVAYGIFALVLAGLQAMAQYL